MFFISIHTLTGSFYEDINYQLAISVLLYVGIILLLNYGSISTIVKIVMCLLIFDIITFYALCYKYTDTYIPVYVRNKIWFSANTNDLYTINFN